jgi:CubicO group peptidase (beta-lactamase class C family)
MLQNGKLRHESYYKDTTAEDRRISWSVAKSFISVLMGIALDEGAIDSIDDPVTKYAPSLMDSAYAGASIEDVLLMSSGVTFDEDYLDPSSDINKMGRVLALGRSMDAFTADLTETFQPAGSAWQYVSIDTHVLGMVLRGATGKSIPALLSEKVVASLGLEAAPYYVTDGYGTAFVLGGLNMRTRDYARFGQMVLQDGKHNGRQIVPADWLRQSTAPLAETKAGAIQYGYQWWIPADAQEGEFMARGIYGQYIYINRNTQTVIALNGAHRGFREEGVFDRNMAVLRQLATQ